MQNLALSVLAGNYVLGSHWLVVTGKRIVDMWQCRIKSGDDFATALQKVADARACLR